MAIGFNSNSGKKPGAGQVPSRPPLPEVPLLSPKDEMTLRRFQKTAARGVGVATDVAGKINNLPNTAVGVGYGLTGHVVGKIRGDNPRIAVRDNAIQFINNPFGVQGAITLGNTTTYWRDPYNPHDTFWYNKDGTSKTQDRKNPVYKHEEAHTRQGELLGPLYIPSNLAGGLVALSRGEDWHGPSNWNEVGPQEHPPRPWPVRR